MVKKGYMVGLPRTTESQVCKHVVWGLLGLLLSLVLVSDGEAVDAELVLDSGDGSSGFSIQDSGTTEVGRIDSSGKMYIQSKMGIGTTSPDTPLCVQGATVLVGDLAVDSTLYVDSTNDNVGIGTTSPGAELDVAGTGLFTDNVGIGTDSPDSTLHVVGNVEIDSDLNVAAGTLFVDESANKVGIGTTSPGAQLDIVETGDNAIVYFLRMYNDDQPSSGETGQEVGLKFILNGDHGTGFEVHDAAYIIAGKDEDFVDNDWGDISANLRFYVATSGTASECMRIDSSGNVGIGTASPSNSRLVVEGDRGGSYAGEANCAVSVEGDVYVTEDVSALTFTDRTPYPKDTEIAYASVLSMERLPDGEYDENDKERQLDHSKLHPFIKADDGRDLSATVSAQNEVIKSLVKRIEVLEAKLNIRP